MSQKVIDFAAQKFWLSLPEDLRRMILANVRCSACRDVVTIKDYVVCKEDDFIVIRGPCSKCGRKCARVVERE